MLYLSAVILAFFLSIVLFTKKNKSTADWILAAWIAVTGVHLLAFYLDITNKTAQWPWLMAVRLPLPLAQGPFLYLYTRHQTSMRSFGWKSTLHFLPLVISYLSIASFFFLSFQEQSEIIRLKGSAYETQLRLNLYAVYLSGVVYIVWSLFTLFGYRKRLVYQFSNTEKINFNWLLYLIFWITGIWITILFVGGDELIFGAAALFVIWLGYFGIKQVRVFSQEIPELPSIGNPDVVHGETTDANGAQQPNGQTENLKYQKSSLTSEEAARIHELLNKLMEEQKLFKNPDLTLNDLAKQLNVHPNHLSQVINSRENKNFYDLVNERRVREFIELISNQVNTQYTLLGLALDCGFNSKASFNRNFKKYTRLTPSDYLKLQSVGN